MRSENEIKNKLEFIEACIESDVIDDDSKHDLGVMANTTRWCLGIIDDDGEVIDNNDYQS